MYLLDTLAEAVHDGMLGLVIFPLPEPTINNSIDKQLSINISDKEDNDLLCFYWTALTLSTLCSVVPQTL